MTLTLPKCVSIGATTLLFVTNTPVEIITSSHAAPKRNSPLRKQIIDHLRDRSVNLPHHRPKIFLETQISHRVVVISNQCRHPRSESVKLRVMTESIPKD